MQVVRNSKKFVLPFIPLLLTCLVLVGCTVSLPPATPAEGTATPEPEQVLAGTNWQLIALGDVGAATPVLTGSTVTLAFSADGQAGGNGGCNSYGGDYTVEGDTVTFGEIISTLMACADQNVTEQEQQYLAALGAANRFAITADTLTIWFDDGAGELNFVATSPAVTPTPVVTATLPAPATLLPTVTPAPMTGDGSSEADATRITFGPGAISTEIQGNLAERATAFYVLAAQQGQIMSVEITSPNNDVLLSVIGQDGTPLKRYQNGPHSWTSMLPATQDYFIHVVSVGPTSDYTL